MEIVVVMLVVLVEVRRRGGDDSTADAMLPTDDELCGSLCILYHERSYPSERDLVEDN